MSQNIICTYITSLNVQIVKEILSVFENNIAITTGYVTFSVSVNIYQIYYFFCPCFKIQNLVLVFLRHCILLTVKNFFFHYSTLKFYLLVFPEARIL